MLQWKSSKLSQQQWTTPGGGEVSLVQYYGTYEAPLIPMAPLLAIRAGLWLKVDSTRPLLPS